jgi:c-di-GMP-binding flagellar brake protein YcgR
MPHKRIYIRVPLSAEASLAIPSNPTVRVKTIDISQGGVATVAFSEEVPNADYRIEILTEEGQKIEIFAKLVHAEDSIAGFHTLKMDKKSQEIINNLVFDYQTTPDFIEQMEKFDLFGDKVVDENGNVIDITFEKVIPATKHRPIGS